MNLFKKAGLPAVPGCIEHTAMIRDSMQRAKKSSDLAVVWLDLANGFGKCLWLYSTQSTSDGNATFLDSRGSTEGHDGKL